MIYPKFVPSQMKVSVIKVVSYDDRVIGGTLRNPFYAQVMPFYGMVQLISLIENLHEELNYPEQVMQMRVFPEADKSMDLTPCLKEEKTQGSALATFKLSIFFKQNASWQGSIVWEEREHSAQFRSVLELIWLLDSALRELIQQKN